MSSSLSFYNGVSAEWRNPPLHGFLTRLNMDAWRMRECLSNHLQIGDCTGRPECGMSMWGASEVQQLTRAERCACFAQRTAAIHVRTFRMRHDRAAR
eukprot:6207157-Pleurochrysis_carterae.AAC.4